MKKPSGQGGLEQHPGSRMTGRAPDFVSELHSVNCPSKTWQLLHGSLDAHTVKPGYGRLNAAGKEGKPKTSIAGGSIL